MAAADPLPGTVVEEAEPDRALALRRPDVPVDLGELAAMKGAALEIIETRATIIATLRAASIKATHPEDWLLFKAPDSEPTAYLQDCGGDRVRDLWGIEIYGVSTPERVNGAEAGVFHYLITGNGRCSLTKQHVEAIEGGRSSNEDFCKGKTGAELELAVRKAARANLDGNITRELAGLKNVPIVELERAWQGTAKKIEHCRKGRGFGTRDERLGAVRQGVPDVPPPTCPYCKPANTVALAYRKGKDGKGDFYGCPNYQQHPQQKYTVDAAKWITEQQKAAKADPACAICGKPKAAHANADHEFDHREPGAEG